MFSWSKRQSGSETYYRTGGIIPIDASPDLSSNGVEAKVRIDDSRSLSALAWRIDVVAQNEANLRALAEACPPGLRRTVHAATLWSFTIR
jgi:hypothetical protein